VLTLYGQVMNRKLIVSDPEWIGISDRIHISDRMDEQ
jgi:hypothetical protein